MSGDQLMLDDVLNLPAHLRDGLWRVESAGIARFEAGGLAVCGMGGSAIGGELAAAAFGDRLSRPLLTVRGYALPSWMPADAAVLCSSFSGETEETLACYDAARARGARTIVATTGGALGGAARRDGVAVIGIPAAMAAPRAAVGYMFAIAVEVAALCGAAPAIRAELEAAAARLEAARTGLVERAARLADSLDGSVPVVYGSDLSAPIAYRWKTQLNENAKWPAFASALPEADHNELAGWQGLRPGGEGPRLSAVFLADRDQHPRERRRFELTAELVAPHATAVETVETEGESRTERLLWAVMLGDLLSLQLAARRGVDPLPIEAIDRLKRDLGEP